MVIASALRLSAPPALRSAPRCAALPWQDAIYRNLHDERSWDAVEAALRAAVRTGAQLPGDEDDPTAAQLLTAAPPLDPAHIDAELTQEARTWQGKRQPRQTWALRLAYYGPAFSSFTWQPTAPETTVWGSVEEALRPLISGQKSLMLSCAGRTDAGVSAVGQCISFYSWTPLDATDIAEAVDNVRPGLLRLRAAHRVPRSFHATFGAKWRRYVYLLPARSLAAEDDDAERLDAALRPLVGAARDYSALGRGVPAGKETRCVLHAASARRVRLLGATRDAVRIEVVGDRFIRRQMRTLVATALHAVQSSPADELALLRLATSGDPNLTAPAAPALGLCFADAGYADYEPPPKTPIPAETAAAITNTPSGRAAAAATSAAAAARRAPPPQCLLPEETPPEESGGSGDESAGPRGGAESSPGKESRAEAEAEASLAEVAVPGVSAEPMSALDTAQFVGTVGFYMVFFYGVAALLQPLAHVPPPM